MKKVLLAIAQFVLFFVVFAVGSFAAPFNLRQLLSVSAQGMRFFIWDGVVLMVGFFVVILVAEGLRGRIRSAGPWTAAALVLALVAGLALKLGFLTV